MAQPLVDNTVIVRQLAMADVEVFARLANDATIAVWTRVPYPYTRLHAQLFIGTMQQQYRRRYPPDLALGIIERSSDRLVGCIGVHRIDHLRKYCDIGYWLGREARGRGYSTAACRLVIPYILDALRLQRIEIFCHPNNLASQYVAEALGGKHVGYHARRCSNGFGVPLAAKTYLITRTLFTVPPQGAARR